MTEEKKEITDAEYEALAMMQMYQAGFLDGHRAACKNPDRKRSDQKYFARIKMKCMATFDKRFKTNIIKHIGEINDKTKNMIKEDKNEHN